MVQWFWKSWRTCEKFIDRLTNGRRTTVDQGNYCNTETDIWFGFFPHLFITILYLFLDPACQNIDVKHNCYRLDPSCSSGISWNNISHVQDKTNENANTSNEVIMHGFLALGALLVLTLIAIFVLSFCLWKMKKQRKGLYTFFVCLVCDFYNCYTRMIAEFYGHGKYNGFDYTFIGLSMFSGWI